MRNLTLLLAAAALTLVTASRATAATSPRDQTAITAIEAQLSAVSTKAGGVPAYKTLAVRMAELRVPGVSIAFIEDGKVKWARAYGVAEAGGPRPVELSTLFQAASMSKPVAAAAALRLVDRRQLTLDEDINTRLAAWKVPESPYTAQEKVTVRRLLSHTAGMTVSGFPGYETGKPVPTTVQVLDGLPPSNTPAIRSFEAPGGQYAYSGGGYTVAQLAMVESGRKAYPELLRSLVLRPAGMRRSTYEQPLPAGLIPRSATGHGIRGIPIAGGRNIYPEYAAASLWTTPSEYGRFLIALQDSYAGRRNALLSPSSAKAMMTAVDANYGLGIALGRRGGRPFIQHGGSNAGFQSNAFAFLEGSRQGVVIMTNGDAAIILIPEIMRTLAVAYGWGELDPATAGSPRRAPLTPAAPK